MSHVCTYWIIRHKPTGRVLPARVPATQYDFDSDRVSEPRLFITERAAKNCATCWAQGAWAQVTRTDRDGWEMPSYTYLAEAVPQPVEGRRREQLEAVRVTLSVPS